MIVPFGAGSGSDTFVRIVAKAIRVEGLLPEPLVIINVGGAGGTIGSRRVKNARPDGYTMLALHEAILTAKHSGSAAYGPEAFEPIAGTGLIGIVIAAREASPYQGLPDLLDAATQNPDTILMGANLGAPSHFLALLLENAHPGARFRFTQTGGGASRLSSLIGGHIELSVFSVEEFLRYQSAGIKALASFGESRHPALPDVPTAAEQGVPVESTNTLFWWFPKGVPDERIQVIANALEAAMATPYTQSQLERSQTLPLFIPNESVRSEIGEREVAIAAASLRETQGVPNFPLWTGLATALLLALALLPQRDRPEPSDTSNEKRSASRAWIGYVLVTAYTAVLASGLIGFVWATLGFVFAFGLLLERPTRRSLIASAALALLLGFGLHFLFTRILVIDLPG